ncbi:uncharacterized protein LOC111345789, partial [Stylophora pistillata]|uniref:uncharacterized protein LOC111345789 n=1 Tax=Stylophora pistillata TaxID=50429 RepID=UPI000C051F1D
EEKVGDSGHYSSDSDLSGANSSGNCLVIEASQGHKRFRGEPSSATEGLRETFVEVESQKWDTVTNNNRNYTFGGQLDGVKINSTPYSKQAQGVRTCSTTQVTEKEASVCAVTVERQQHQWIMLSTSDTEEEQIQVSDQFSTDPEESGAHITLPPVCSNTSDLTKMVPITLPLALQPTLPKGDLMEGKQMISSTVLSQLKSLDISGKDKEFQNSHEQVHTETFPAKGNLSGQLLGQPSYLKTQVSAKEASVSAVAKDNQQHTPVTVGASDDKIVELLASFEDEIHSGLISPQGGANSPALDSMNVGSIEEWLKQYDYEVSINPTESPLQGGGPCIFTFKPELPSGVNVKATFGNLEPNILEKTSLGYICKIPASPEMTPAVIPVLLISTTTGKILAETFIEYCEVEKGGIWQTIQRITSDPNLQRILLTQLLLYMQSNFGGKPGTCGSGKRGDGSSDGGPSGGGASGGGAYGGGSSGEGPRGSGASGDGTGGTGVSGCGSNGCGAFGSGATRCQYSRGASQPGSDAVWELCELIQKCSVCIWRQNPFTTHNKACTEDEEDLEDDQLLMIHQPSDENYFADTEDYSSVSSESDSALSDSENWDESLSDSSLSFPWVNSRSRKSQKAIAKTESTEHFYKAVNSELNVSHEILTALTEGLNSEISIGEDESHCLEWNTHLSGSKKTEENDEKDDHNEKLDSSQECALCYEASTSHTLLASQDNTLMLCIDVPALNVENEESQYQDDELFETLHTENAKPQQLQSILSVTSNQQSTTHTGPVTQKAARSPLSNPLWIGIGDSKLNMASPQCSDEEIHSGHEWKESGLASWFDLCENEDAEKNEPSRWEMSSMEPNKTDGGVEKDVFDSEQDLSQEQRFFSEKGNLDIHLSSPDDTSVQSLGPEVENKESQLYVDIQLAHAASNGDTRVARLLIKNGADVNKEGEETPLTAAAQNGHTDMVRLLIENGADVNKEGGGEVR